MSKTIRQAIDAEDKGLLIKNSIFLPFHIELMSVWIGKDMSTISRPDVLTDFSSQNRDIHIREGDSYTNLTFVDHKDLKKEYGHYKGHIILFGAEKGVNIFDESQRHYIKLSFHDDTSNVYMELIDDPLNL
mgnify:FL=1|jgi:hypothetical protein